MPPELDEKSVTTLLESLRTAVTGLKYAGWTKYDFRRIFSRLNPIHENKAIQKVNFMRPALGLLWLEDRWKLIALCAAAAEEVAAELAARDATISEHELNERIKRQTGRADTVRACR